MKNVRKIDRQRINDLSEEIERRLNLLKEFAKTEEAKFLADHLIFSATERHLQVAIEACMDIARHFIAKIPLNKPKRENKEMFLILAHHRIILDSLAKRLYKMAGMRNIFLSFAFQCPDEI